MIVLESEINRKFRAEEVKDILLGKTKYSVIETGIEDASANGIYYYNIVEINNDYYKFETFQAYLTEEISYYAQIPIPVIPVHTIKYIAKEDLI